MKQASVLFIVSLFHTFFLIFNVRGNVINFTNYEVKCLEAAPPCLLHYITENGKPNCSLVMKPWVEGMLGHWFPGFALENAMVVKQREPSVVSTRICSIPEGFLNRYNNSPNHDHVIGFRSNKISVMISAIGAMW